MIDPALGLQPRCVHSWSMVMREGLKGFVAEARAYFRLLPLIAIPFALHWLWHGRASTTPGSKVTQQRRVLWCLVAWLATATIFALIGLMLNLYVRYSLFVAPVVAICMGIVLARIWSLNSWSRLIGWGTVLYFVLTGLGLWYTLIIYTAH